ncbi:disulfide bond formation protein B [Rhodopseudomonas palustris]|uniref:disulfide bond formation protein B n=1 Tax=Rhodopseudomonas palustris TaxID=1076 RepID=UPI002ACEF166|nr:disulfide bond formation protein B [Rhodopseudomonas palustris]WQH01317.1 disulfide bond formation protein B [Rhodopseudomonas palustris]
MKHSSWFEQPSLLLAAVFVVSVGALGVAFAGEHLLGAEPCILCLYQRVPYAITVILAALGAILPISSLHKRFVVATCGVVFLLGAMLALYSVGVEEHWWAGVAGCTGNLPEGLSLDRLGDRTLVRPLLRPCDVEVWRLFGLSMAAYNSGFQAILCAGCAVAMWLHDRINRHD